MAPFPVEQSPARICLFESGFHHAFFDESNCNAGTSPEGEVRAGPENLEDTAPWGPLNSLQDVR